MSTTDREQIRESLPAKDRRPNHWAMPPTWCKYNIHHIC